MKNKMILVTTYINPDLDGFSAATALAEFLNKTGRPSQAGFFGDFQPEVKFVAAKFGIDLPAFLENPEDFDQIILVDVSDLKRLDKSIDPQKVIEIIDHREVTDLSSFPNAKSQIEIIGATATLVAERLKAANFGISKESAMLLSAAIVSHTIDFQAPGAGQRDKDVFQWLKIKCDFPASFIREIFLAKSDFSGAKLGQAIEGNLKQFEFAGRKIAIASLEAIDVAILVRSRKQEIISKLAELKQKLKPDFVFLMIIDMEKLATFFVSEEPETQDLLKTILGVEFKDDAAQTQKFVMRKGVALYLQQWFGKK